MTGGRLVSASDPVAASCVIDNRDRDALEGAAFFAIRGERHDGHDFVASALEVAAGAVVSRIPEDVPTGRGIVEVGDTLVALQSLARAVREAYPFTLVAVTGSTGKTTTKEMIAALVGAEKRTWKSKGNLNNHIGFPLSLVNTPDDAEVVVSEMGMNHAGEIEFLAKLSSPDVGVYTNIRPVHLEFFASIDGIAAAKRELVENLRDDGTVVVNADDFRVVEITAAHEGPRVTYGVEREADFRAIDIEDLGLRGCRFTIVAPGGTRRVELPLAGRHNVENAMAAVATARLLGVSWDAIEAALAELHPAAHRGVIVELRGATIYDDSYNSNPWALERTLALLSRAECSGRRIAVVGDMLELGPEELSFHYEAGRKMPSNVDLVVAVGPRSRSIVAGAEKAGFDAARLRHVDDAAAAAELLDAELREGDLVLVKASRGIGLDRVVTKLEERG